MPQVRTPSITEQIRAAVDAAGGQAAVVRAIRDAGGTTSKNVLSGIYNGRTPTIHTLRDIAKATGATFTICGDTDTGEARPPMPSDKKK